jgi:hypothetical protein
MWIYFPPQSDARPDSAESTSAVQDDPCSRLPISAETLRRHGARELVPGEAALLPGQQQPLSTIYRSDALVVPRRLLASEPSGPGTQPGRLGSALQSVGLAFADVAPPGPPPGPGGPEPDDRLAAPRAARLTVGRGEGPTVVDAWRALQALRAAGLAERPDDEQAPGAAGTARGITLQHLLFGASVGSRVLLGAPGATEGSGFEDDATAAYSRPGAGARVPVDVLADVPPERVPGPRRPVVAVLDTGIGTNRWLGVPAKEELQGTGDYILFDDAIQQAVADAGQRLAVDPLTDYWDDPITGNPLVGELTSHTGHGTFIAGIFRQVVPDARVLAIRVMRPDGITYIDELRRALQGIADRNERARAAGGDPALFVDVVSLSLRYYPEDRTGVSDLAADIRALTDQGVLVVAAAGNEASARLCYPAALATENPGVIAVGALNPNGSVALFSNEAPWVTAWASGGSVVSTYPEIQATREPTVVRDQNGEIPRETIDYDDFHGGWAVWSGTSFAAPLVAAAVLERMVTNHEAGHGSLDEIGRDSTLARMTEAVGDVRGRYDARPDKRT